MKDSLETCLERLETTDLVRRLLDPELSYLIRHTLVQETVTASLLNQERRRLNRLVGECLESLYPDQPEELLARLAQHFVAAGDDTKSYSYCYRAGEAELHLSALDEALEHFTLALEAAQRAHLPTQDAYLKRGRVFELRGQFDAALENYRTMYAYGEQQNDRTLQLAALIAQATIQAIPSSVFNIAQSSQASATALTLARELNDAAAEAKILWNLMLLESRQGTNYTGGIDYGEKSIAIAREHSLREQLAYTLNDLAGMYAFTGEPERGKQYNREARALWREFGNQPMLADNLNVASMMNLLAGEYLAATKTVKESLAISRAIGNEWGEAFAQMWSGVAWLEQGDVTKAIQTMKEGIRVGANSLKATQIFTRADLARLYGDLGAIAQGISLAERTLATADESYAPLRGWALGSLTHLYIVKGDLAAARTYLQAEPTRMEDLNNPRFGIDLITAQAELALADQDWSRALDIGGSLLEYLRRIKIRQYLPMIMIHVSRAYIGLGQLDPAAALLQEARTLSEEMNARWSLWHILAAQKELEQQRGNFDAAASLTRQARACIAYIVARTPKEFRKSFLHTALVQRAILPFPPRAKE